MDGPEARLLESYALAVSASDAADLIGISDDALGGGHGLLALEAAQQAERILADDPDRWRLTAVQRRVHHRLVEAGMSAQLEIVHSDHGAALTGREAEVLELVSARGHERRDRRRRSAYRNGPWRGTCPGSSPNSASAGARTSWTRRTGPWP